jgi:hypothetical protein
VTSSNPVSDSRGHGHNTGKKLLLLRRRSYSSAEANGREEENIKEDKCQLYFSTTTRIAFELRLPFKLRADSMHAFWRLIYSLLRWLQALILFSFVIVGLEYHLKD